MIFLLWKSARFLANLLERDECSKDDLEVCSNPAIPSIFTEACTNGNYIEVDCPQLASFQFQVSQVYLFFSLLSNPEIEDLVLQVWSKPHPCSSLVLLAMEWLHELLWWGAGEASVSAGAGGGQEKRHPPAPQGREEWWGSPFVPVCRWVVLKCGVLTDRRLLAHSKRCLHRSGLLPENWSQAASNSETKTNPTGECHLLFRWMCQVLLM